MKPICCVIIFSSILALCCSQQRLHTVKTRVGTIQGFVKEVDAFGALHQVANYLGIPYAIPPVGARRFEKPVPMQPFTDTYPALKYGDACMGMDFFLNPFESSEDCLSLNVYVPVAQQSDDRPLLAVMVWIHGGAYVSGSSRNYIADVFSAFGNVVTVTLNYRLGVFGFFSTDDGNSPGNYGLWDQHIAIRWVHDNIRDFGGDPGRVTVFGESVGASSVVYQSLYEGNKGLFQRAIAQSGSITASWASSETPLDGAQRLGRHLGCNTSDPSLLTDCVRYTSASRIDSVSNSPVNGFIKLPLDFVPSIDGEFVKESPWDAMYSHSKTSELGRILFSSLDLIYGMNAMEGATLVGPLIGVKDPFRFNPSRSQFEGTLVPAILATFVRPDVPDDFIQSVITEYTSGDNCEDPAYLRKQLVSILSDMFITSGTINTVNLHARMSEQKTYLYHFHPRPSHHLYRAPDWVDKATHADELMFLFGFHPTVLKALRSQVDEGQWDYDPLPWELKLSKVIMTAWSNFAKTGNPNKPDSLVAALGSEWPVYDIESQRYINFTRERGADPIGHHLYKSTADFWMKHLPALKKMKQKETEVCSLSKDEFTHPSDSGCKP